MITRIFIDNVRCFTNFEFKPKRLNLLLGSNGSGKSALFEVLTGLVDLVVMAEHITELFPADSRTRWDQRMTQRVELDLTIDSGHYRYVLVIQHDPEQGTPSILNESVVCDGKTLFAFQDGHVHLHRNDGSKGVSFPFRGNMSFLAQIERRPEVVDLVAWLDFMSDIWAVRLDIRNIDSTAKGEHPTLDRDGLNFASWYRHFSQEAPERAQSLFSSLETIIPGFRALALLSSDERGRARDLAIRMAVGGKDYKLNFHELSDGQRALIVLYTLLEARSGQGCLLLDEPELHLGLAEVQPWLVELDTRFEDHGQIFLISNNPEVVNYMAASDPFMFERPDGGPARVRPAVFDRETGLTASEQLARGLADAG